MAPPQQKPETFMLSNEAQQSLPLEVQQALHQVDNLKYFLISAPVDWDPSHLIRRFLLPTGDYIACVLWNNLFHISGTDIVRCLSFRFQAFGRPVKNTKKFEEGIFSDLRNLKAGTDASLEEPKSPFLDFLYKNNCIRTQKKQKVFYWYSVPHDRLFLDALERDLKREKMGQEPTTIAISEPALSFEFDASQSLFEQLTKAQQANTSSLAANVGVSYGHTASPMVRASEAMPPPQMAPPSMQVLPEEMPAPMYAPVNVAPPVMHGGMVKVEQDYSQFQYDRPVMPLRMAPRHASMPAYMEYSPAPSFVSSHYDEYATRGISYEPVTPPQHGGPVTSEPAYISNEDTGLYSAVPEMSAVPPFNPMMSVPPPGFASQAFTSAPQVRSYPAANVYPVIEGSPTYKQRRRRSSIPSSISNAVAGATSNPVTPGGVLNSMRYNDYSRPTSAVPTSIPDAQPMQGSPQTVTEVKASNYNPVASAAISAQSRDLIQDFSRHGTPYSSHDDGTHERDGSVVFMGAPVDDHQQVLANPALLAQGGDYVHNSPAHARLALDGHGGRGPVRRARSANTMDIGPYPQHKSHSCPIPSCGRFFKRLEHLKRAFSRSDNLAQHKRTHESHQNQTQTPSAPVTATDSPKYALTIPDEDHESQEQESHDWTSTMENDNISENGRLMMPPSNPASSTNTANDIGGSSTKSVIANNLFSVSASSSPVIHSGQVNGTGMLAPHGITPQLLRQRI
ncbi:homeodomain transcription factor ste12 [Ascosphaera pollenicola]|nr:homeodomain transcription factor ste12 [Ascosphaera pollenicola]